jgi:glycosyltransferase involved in cell wall biosynthesis
LSDRNPLVTAVIPTRNRPELVCRAVHSVLSQSLGEIECIVVIDGPDLATVDSLGEVRDPRLRVIALPESVGACEARNLGARAARAEWVALLDDDDEWLPLRLERQMAALAKAVQPVTMVVSRFLDRGAGNDLVRPHRFPLHGQAISEFLWCEVSPFGGITGFPQTSTWLLRRDFLLQVPFTKGQKLLQDLDWLLRAYPHPQMRVLFLQEPLTIFHNDQGRQRVTKKIDWRYSFRWAMRNRSLFTPKALGFFIAIYCINPAAQQQAPWSGLRLMFKAIGRYSKTTPKLLGLCFLYVLVYPAVGKVLSPRKRATMLYQMRSLVRRPV